MQAVFAIRNYVDSCMLASLSTNARVEVPAAVRSIPNWQQHVVMEAIYRGSAVAAQSAITEPTAEQQQWIEPAIAAALDMLIMISQHVADIQAWACEHGYTGAGAPAVARERAEVLRIVCRGAGTMSTKLVQKITAAGHQEMIRTL